MHCQKNRIRTRNTRNRKSTVRKFARLIKTLDSTNKTNLKVEALSNYFLKSSNEDMLWAIALMSIEDLKDH